MPISSVTVLGDGSELEIFRKIPNEEFHLHERWELALPRSAPFSVEGRASSAWIATESAALIPPGWVHRLQPGGAEPEGLERLYVRTATARVLVPIRWRTAAERGDLVVPRAVARDWCAALRTTTFITDGSPPAPAAQPSHHGLAQAVRYLEDNLERTVSLDELSRVCGLSKFHLCRVFHRIVGVTPRTYHRHIRLERGRALLHAGRAASDIARDLGFSDQSHFIRSFRKQFGVTPGDFVQARRSPGRVAACA